MSVLVTGGAGYIGSITTRKLLDAGHSCVVFDDLSTGFRDAVPERAHFVEGSVLDQALLQQVFEKHAISSVVHFAAKLIVPESIVKPLEYYESNTAGVIALAKASAKNGVQKFVFSSTAAVYGNAAGAEQVSEKVRPLPINPYGASKLMSEHILRDVENAHRIRSVCLRYFNVAGASSDLKCGQRTRSATHLIKVVAEAACGKRPSVAIYGDDYPTKDGTGVRDYIHVEDLADLHVLALNYLNAGNPSKTLNCGYGKGFSVLEVVQMFQKISGQQLCVEKLSRREGDPAEVVADPSELRQLFKWNPAHDLESICRSALDWESRLGLQATFNSASLVGEED